MQLLKIKELCLPLNVVVGRDNPTFVCVFAFHQLGSPIFSTLCVSWCDRCRIREVGGWFYPNLQWGLLKRTRMVRVKRVTPQLGVSFVLSQGIFYMVLACLFDMVILWVRSSQRFSKVSCYVRGWILETLRLKLTVALHIRWLVSLQAAIGNTFTLSRGSWWR